MDVGRLYAVPLQIFREFLSHSLGEGGDQGTLSPLYAYLNLLHEVIHLILCRTNLYHGVRQSSGSDELFHHDTLALSQLIVGGRCTYIDNLMSEFLKLLKLQRTVVAGCRQTESIIHQIVLACSVSAIHGTYLWHRHMTLIYDGEVILREEVEQAIGTSAWFAPVKISAIVLNTRAVSQFPDHLHVIGNTLMQPLGLEHPAFLLKESHLLGQVILYLAYGLLLCLMAGHEEIGRIDLIILKRSHALQSLWFEFLDGLYLISPEGDAQNLVGIGKSHIHGITLDTHLATCQSEIVTHIEAVRQLSQQLLSVHPLSYPQLYHILIEGSRITHAIDA